MSNHTPTPWTVEFLRWTPESEAVGFRIDSSYSVDHLPTGMRMHSIVNANCSEQPAYTACWTTEQIEANAAFIVRAVNAHDDLVATLQWLRDNYAAGRTLEINERIDSALAKATA